MENITDMEICADVNLEACSIATQLSAGLERRYDFVMVSVTRKTCTLIINLSSEHALHNIYQALLSYALTMKFQPVHKYSNELQICKLHICNTQRIMDYCM